MKSQFIIMPSNCIAYFFMFTLFFISIPSLIFAIVAVQFNWKKNMELNANGNFLFCTFSLHLQWWLSSDASHNTHFHISMAIHIFFVLCYWSHIATMKEWNMCFLASPCAPFRLLMFFLLLLFYRIVRVMRFLHSEEVNRDMEK